MKDAPKKELPGNDAVAMEIQDGVPSIEPPQNIDENTMTGTPSKSPTKRVILSPTKKAKRSPKTGSPAKTSDDVEKTEIGSPKKTAKVSGADGDQEMSTKENVSPRK